MVARHVLHLGAAVLAAMLAACSAAGPAATPSPTAPPTPSPTPVDAAPAFLAVLADPAFSATAELSGQLEMGALTMPISGSMEFSEGDSHMVLNVRVGSTPQTTETLSVDGRTYLREQDRWFVQAPGSAGAGSGDDFLSLTGFEDRGIERRDGVAVHRLELTTGAEGLPLAAFGIRDPSMTGGSADVTAFALDDGTPVAIAYDFAWNQDVNGTPVEATMTFEMAFAGVGAPLTLDAPDVSWSWYASDRYGYRIAHPSTWDVEPGGAEANDFITGFDRNYISVWSGPADGERLSGYVGYITKNLDEWYVGTDAALEGSSAAMLGGVGGRELDVSVTWPDGTYWLLDVMTVRDDTFYTVAYVLEREPTAADRELFTSILETFSFE